MTELELAEIEQRLEKATPLPWVLHGKYCVKAPSQDHFDLGKMKMVVQVRANQNYRSPEEDQANAIFITRAKSDIILLLEEVNRLRKILEAWGIQA